MPNLLFHGEFNFVCLILAHNASFGFYEKFTLLCFIWFVMPRFFMMNLVYLSQLALSTVF